MRETVWIIKIRYCFSRALVNLKVDSVLLVGNVGERG